MRIIAKKKTLPEKILFFQFANLRLKAKNWKEARLLSIN
jgi:hypothetical protein